MIRSYRKTDLEEMVRIWYEASVTAHSFIPASFWASHKSAMKEKYLPFAENFIFEERGQLAGFISLVEEKVCALFISPEMQGRGIGKSLLEHAKTLKESSPLKSTGKTNVPFAFMRIVSLRQPGKNLTSIRAACRF